MFRRYLGNYIGYTLMHLILSPYLTIRGLLRARKRSYQQILWSRLLLFPLRKAPKRSHAIYGLGIGEAAKAAKFLQIIQTHTGAKGYVLCETDEAQRSEFEKVDFYPAPFNNPLSVLIALLILRPTAIWIVENLNNHHFKAIAAALRVPLIMFNVQDSIDDDLANSQAFWRMPLIGLYATQSEVQATKLRTFHQLDHHVWVVGPLAMGPPAVAMDSEAEPDRWRLQLGIHPSQGPVIVAASTWEADEVAVIDAFSQFRAEYEGAVLVIAPRDIARTPQLQTRLQLGGLVCARRTQAKIGAKPDVVVLDSLGELRHVYAIADLAFVGGTFDPSVGGHSPLEAVAFFTPTACGPWFSHQRELMERLLSRDLVVSAMNPVELCRAWTKLYKCPGLRSELATRYKAFLVENELETEKFFVSATKGS
jgi:3-deoxy-D-manno-octulosonic-acid transferase